MYSHARFSIAPMMDWTDRHCRMLHRQLSRHAVLYTEMVTTGALDHGDRARHLEFSAEEQPVVLQVGGSDPDAMARAAALGEAWGYAAVNINVGCPSDRVQNGRFGACLMAEPHTVAACVVAMRGATALPITVKSRIGIDDMDDYDHLRRFVDTVAAAGCSTFIVHARKAWLQGLSPKENRDVPPLVYPSVYRLKAERPDLHIHINGGIRTLDAAAEHLKSVDGVMIGREAYQNPYLLAEVDRRVFGAGPMSGATAADRDDPVSGRAAVVIRYLPYVEAQCAAGVPVKAITRHMLGLFQGVPGGRLWRRHLSEHAHRPGAGARVIRDALDRVQEAAARRPVRAAA